MDNGGAIVKPAQRLAEVGHVLCHARLRDLPLLEIEILQVPTALVARPTAKAAR